MNPKITKAALSVVIAAAAVQLCAAGNPFKTEYVTPTRIIWTSDSTGEWVAAPENLLKEFSGQVSVTSRNLCTLKNGPEGNASIVLDFGKEYQGGIQIAAAMRHSKKPVNVRVRLGESVTEAMSDDKTATNDHAMRDFVVAVPWLGTVTVGESGFRFARIDLVDEGAVLPLAAVRAVAKYRDIPYTGSFDCDDARLNEIWKTGAWTVHLNMQEYLWDGIKRDRLVWLGDMHPEVMCINTVFGENEVVPKSLDFARDDTPLPGWINGMPSYSIWWIIIHRDLYLYRGDLEYLRLQRDYLEGLVAQLLEHKKGAVEAIRGGTRFLDWPTSEMPEVIHAGLQALMIRGFEAAADIARWTGEAELEGVCRRAAGEMKGHLPAHLDNKQAASLMALAGLTPSGEASKIVLKDGANGFSTFYGYYMLEALAMSGHYEEAMQIISDYWGGMLDLGATTFWEDLTYSDLARASRIDEIVPEGAFDIHKDTGDYCYVGLRHSYCHGWASGPTSWLSRHVLGIVPLEAGFKKVAIRPNLGKLTRAEGTFPTPHGVIKVSHTKRPNGSIDTKIEVPQGIEVL